MILPTATGARLALCRWLATTPRGVVQINHGLGEHGGRYEAFGRFLVENGFHAYAHDHRGHGDTRAPGTPRGGLGGLAVIDADLFDLHELITREHPGLPVIVFGQGVGALIAAHFVFGHAPRLAGAALWNVPIATDYAARFLRGTLRWERFRLGSDLPSPTMARIIRGWSRKVGDDRTGFGWLSEDAAVVEAYLADPSCGRNPTISAWIDVSRMMSHAGSKRAWAGLPRDLPLHIAAGCDDPVTDKGRMVEDLTRRLKRLGFGQVIVQRHERLRHDLVNGSNREPVWRDFADWAQTVIHR